MTESEFQRLVDDTSVPFRVDLCMALSVFLRVRFLPAFLLWLVGVLSLAAGGYLIMTLLFVSSLIALFAGLFYSAKLSKKELESRKIRMLEGYCIPIVDLTVMKANVKKGKNFKCRVDFECLRCARCCQGYVTMVPVYQDSDLSPRYLTGYLKEFGFLKLLKYIKKHAGFSGEQCPWLDFDVEGKALCKCHPRRSIYCSQHLPFNRMSSKCVVGKKKLGLK